MWSGFVFFVFQYKGVHVGFLNVFFLEWVEGSFWSESKEVSGVSRRGKVEWVKGEKWSESKGKSKQSWRGKVNKVEWKKRSESKEKKGEQKNNNVYIVILI